MQKIALLSNVNMEPVIQNITKKHNIFKTTGYGNVFEEMANKNSQLYKYNPEVIYIIIDIKEICINCESIEQIHLEVSNWFSLFRKCINSHIVYFISDVDFRSYDMEIGTDDLDTLVIEQIWKKELKNVINDFTNIHQFSYKKQVEKIGKDNFYTNKLWYLGRIIHTNLAKDSLIKEIDNCLQLLKETQKKVLILDLDNTIWGGIIGEGEYNNIELSDEKIGLIYKDLQRIIRRIKNTGILLAIVSKNNYEDAISVIRTNQHMILKEDDFIAKKINWIQKDINILEISKEINLGLDSFVFFDDNPAERELVKNSLPDVTVPEFPNRIELLPKAMEEVYTKYFKKLTFTNEDKERSLQYLANSKRLELQKKTMDFTSYLTGLHITVKPVEPFLNRQRLFQLINKTNQFNLTTQRYTMVELEEIIQAPNKKIYAFEISDKFGNNGITAVVIVNLLNQAFIDTFILSCRIMGKFIENYIIDFVEKDLLKDGYQILFSKYIKTSKNKPVEDFYDRMGYQIIEATEDYKIYRISLETKLDREYYIKRS
ncbi:HAD superfamily phosphatase (TIGR01681 family)/FkbH-like protein [Mobilisporobacter senegalensis]|uniref:HAD superfamily phosphatase (TIGR01681 family)/FkbH-like protein n=1 Tax=Mobilisporobacter senegalensis TaxID=1329262 RepID=A0A3N1Y1Y8_9FIRM|nr:HAD-IIIC family phosphatase [Mobilisporobacter senegalensis]ROR31542.1 HAD superfamily phosphatase (TIGR01681 family)/FkbH-like protein [Mobilisporobacter senegalensis]